MNFLEKNLEDIIFQTPNELLYQRGLDIYGTKKRQLRIGNYGIADLVTFTRRGDILYITIYELKKDKVCIDTFLQAMNYVKGISWYLKRRGSVLTPIFEVKLIGKEVDTNNSFCYLPNFVDFLDIYTYDYSFDGIYFKANRDFKLTNDGFGEVNTKLLNNNIQENQLIPF